MIILTKILGVDKVYTKLFKNKKDAYKEAYDDIRIIREDSFNIEENTIEKDGNIFIIANDSKNAYEFIEYVISECTL